MRPASLESDSERLAGATVIDVGFGSGTSTFELAERGAEVVAWRWRGWHRRR